MKKRKQGKRKHWKGRFPKLGLGKLEFEEESLLSVNFSEAKMTVLQMTLAVKQMKKSLKNSEGELQKVLIRQIEAAEGEIEMRRPDYSRIGVASGEIAPLRKPAGWVTIVQGGAPGLGKRSK